MVYFAPFVFFLVSFLFSMLGMGGSQVYIPILFWLGMDFKFQAIPLGIALNIVGSSTATIVYVRKKFVDWRMGLVFGLSMVLFAPMGALANFNIPQNKVIIIFSVFTMLAAFLMLSGYRPKKNKITPFLRYIVGFCAGSVLGFFSGLIGRGGGSFVVPLLYIFGLGPKIAVGTSSLAVTLSGLSSFFAHINAVSGADWVLWGLCSLSVFAGSRLGARFMIKNIKQKALKRIFGFTLIIISTVLIIEDVLLK